MSMFKLRHPPIRSPLAVALLLVLAVPAISHAEPEAQTFDTVRVQGNDAPKHATDARSATRTDAMLRWRGGEHELALNLRNLGDIDWIESAQSTNQTMPGTPLAATLSWRYNFR